MYGMAQQRTIRNDRLAGLRSTQTVDMERPSSTVEVNPAGKIAEGVSQVEACNGGEEPLGELGQYIADTRTVWFAAASPSPVKPIASAPMRRAPCR
jgi:hypothetical protein